MQKSKEKITVVLVEPQKEACVAEIDNTLDAMQGIVGGYIEAVYPFNDEVALVCNEEGKIAGLPLNRALKDSDGKIYDIVAGTFIVAGLSEDNFGSLTKEQVDCYLNNFKHPEKFVCLGDEIVSIPLEHKNINRKEGRR